MLSISYKLTIRLQITNLSAFSANSINVYIAKSL